MGAPHAGRPFAHLTDAELQWSIDQRIGSVVDGARPQREALAALLAERRIRGYGMALDEAIPLQPICLACGFRHSPVPRACPKCGGAWHPID